MTQEWASALRQSKAYCRRLLRYFLEMPYNDRRRLAGRTSIPLGQKAEPGRERPDGNAFLGRAKTGSGSIGHHGELARHRRNELRRTRRQKPVRTASAAADPPATARPKLRRSAPLVGDAKISVVRYVSNLMAAFGRT